MTQNPKPGLDLVTEDAGNGAVRFALVRRARRAPHDIIERVSLASAAEVALAQRLLPVPLQFYRAADGDRPARAVQDMGAAS
jgi:hypothetical protein